MSKSLKLIPGKGVYSYSIEECGDHTNYYINGIELPEATFDSYFEVIETPEHYLALLTEGGEGCGYTIACGLDWVEIDANSYNEALAKLKSIIIGEFDGFGHGGGYRELKSIKLVEVVRYWDIPIEEWYEEAERLEDEAEAKRITDGERAEYERLKKKFEEKS